MAGPPLVSLTGATVGFGGSPLFDGIDLALAAGERACLVGRNGTGKSTLMKMLAGLVEPDRGERFLQPGKRIAYLPQEPDLAGHASLADYVAHGLGPEHEDEWHRVDAILARLRLDPARTPVGLSGGESRRAALARLLVGEPDVLLLDEPTNHLDLPTIEWLEGVLARHRGALLLISHDRTFLTTLANRLLWLDRGRLRSRDGGFAGFEDWQENVFAEEDKAGARLDKRIASETQWLREGLTARRKRNQGRVRALQQMRVDRRERVGRTGVAKLDPAEAAAGGKLIIEAEGLSKTYVGTEGPVPIVDGFSTRIMRGDRVGVIGANGAGKTTLVRLLAGDLTPDAGTIKLGSNVAKAYYDQTRASLSEAANVRDVLLPAGGDSVSVGGRMRHIASYLKDFLFDPSRLDSPVRSLSGGERNRLLLAKLFAVPSNLLILDEPTNDLDMETLDLLEEVLNDYGGTLLLVSHDRDFLDRLVTSIVAVDGNGTVAEYVGGYSDYLRQRPSGDIAARPTPARRIATKESTKAPGGRQAGSRARSAKLGYKERRELESLPERIDQLSAEIADLEESLADPALYLQAPDSFATQTERLTAAHQELSEAEDRWLALAELAEQLAGQ